MDSQPLVSILINNHNYANFVGNAIDSALSQTYDDIEVIVVDDGSTDGSRDVIARYGKRIRAVLKSNAGQASAFNAGFSASNGDLICFLDSDDMFLPGKVSDLVRVFCQHTTAGWCFHPLTLFRSETGEHLVSAGKCSYGQWDARTITIAGRPPYVPTATSGLSFRRTLLSQILPMPEALAITSDNFLKIAALALSPGWMLPEALSLQRIHSGNAYTSITIGKQQAVGCMEVSLGTSLYRQFPMLHRLAENIFAHGMGRLRASGHRPSAIEAEIHSFLNSLRFTARQRVALRALTWCVVESFRRG